MSHDRLLLYKDLSMVGVMLNCPVPSVMLRLLLPKVAPGSVTVPVKVGFARGANPAILGI